MKKIISAFIIFGVLFMFAGCESTESDLRTSNSVTTVEDIIQSEIAREEKDSNSNNMDKNIDKITDKSADLSSSSESIDVDLTELSSTMVYSEVYSMMSAPEDYIGKTVKMRGIFSSSHDDITGKDYYACIITDATACCAQGIEFVLKDDSGYPQDGETVTVVGVFDTYNEGKFRYSTLRDASIIM